MFAEHLLYAYGPCLVKLTACWRKWAGSMELDMCLGLQGRRKQVTGHSWDLSSACEEGSAKGALWRCAVAFVIHINLEALLGHTYLPMLTFYESGW